jgi:hypothetical protein
MQMQISQGLEFEQSTLDTDNSHVDNGFSPGERAHNSSVGSIGSLRNDIVPKLRYP